MSTSYPQATDVLPVIKARDILLMSTRQVWSLGTGVHTVVFDNGESLTTTIRRTIFSRYCWSSLLLYPSLPLLPKYHMGKRSLSKDTAKEIMAMIQMDIIDNNPQHTKAFSEEIWANDYAAINEIYNDFTVQLEAYVTSISARDFVNLLKNPTIESINERIQKSSLITEEHIKDAHSNILKTIKTDPTLQGNHFVNAVRSGVLKYDQVLQIVGPIGFRADVDSRIFYPPIKHGYGHGLTNLYESMLESRSASRSLFFQKKPMEQSEWTNRIVQLMTAIIQNLHEGDCGTSNYLLIHLTSRNRFLDAIGQYYYDDDNGGVLKPIMPEDTHLIGKTVRIRNVLVCGHQDRYGVCETCFGQLSRSIPARTNIGHVAVTILLGTVGQFILSTKHLDKTATAERLTLPLESRFYLQTDERMDSAYLSSNLLGKDFYITFDPEELKYLMDIQYVDDVSVLRPERLSSITKIFVEFVNKYSIETKVVSLGGSAANPVLSMDFISYIRRVGWGLCDQGRIRVDMRQWDYTKPLLTLPMVQFSSPAYMKSIQVFIKGRDEKSDQYSSVTDFDDMGAALMALNDLVGLKLRVNIAHLSVVLLATKIQDPVTMDYRPPLPKTGGTPMKFSDLMMYRSLSAANANAGHLKLAFSKESFMCTKRPPHPLDWIVMPNARENVPVHPSLRYTRF